MLRTLLLPVVLLLGAAAALAPSATPSGTPRMGLDWASRACMECHSIALEHSHPVGVAARSVPGLPLSNLGGIACMTCHQQPASLDRHASGGRGAQLRRPIETLCVACHTQPTRPGSALAHGLNLRRAHLIPGAKEALSPLQGLDRETLHCLSCHDGSVASPAGVRVGGSSSQGSYRPLAPFGRPAWQEDHPIGVSLNSLEGPNANRHSASSMPPGVRLFSGKLGCGSCHSIYSGIDQMLSVDNRRSGLCLVCHIK